MRDPSGAGDVLVAGLGNTLLGDDGFGPAVVRWLHAHHVFPPGVAVEDLGTPGPGISTFLCGRRAVILVDVLRRDAPPGSLHRLDAGELGSAGLRLGPHEVDLRAALDLLALAGEAPDRVVVIGTVPARQGTGDGLSAPVRAAVPRAGALVVEELAGFGFSCPCRPVPRPFTPDWRGERP